MENKPKKEPTDLSEQERKVIRLMRGLDYGEIRIVINGGNPVRVEEVRKSIML